LILGSMLAALQNCKSVQASLGAWCLWFGVPTRPPTTHSRPHTALCDPPSAVASWCHGSRQTSATTTRRRIWCGGWASRRCRSTGSCLGARFNPVATGGRGATGGADGAGAIEEASGSGRRGPPLTDDDHIGILERWAAGNDTGRDYPATHAVYHDAVFGPVKIGDWLSNRRRDARRAAQGCHSGGHRGADGTGHGSPPPVRL